MENRIKDFCENQKYTRITRRVAKNEEINSYGYIVDYSIDFIVMQMTDDFKLWGFEIYPIKSIIKIRHNNNDKYYDKIMVWENEKKDLGIKTKVNLRSCLNLPLKNVLFSLLLLS